MRRSAALGALLVVALLAADPATRHATGVQGHEAPLKVAALVVRGRERVFRGKSDPAGRGGRAQRDACISAPRVVLAPGAAHPLSATAIARRTKEGTARDCV
jgi:hypothetical protein